MRIIHLSATFYEQYGSYPEILEKSKRPYSCLTVTVKGTRYAIPLRHHIHHPYCFHTTGEAGVDYTKAIPILSDDFVSDEDVRIDNKEWSIFFVVLWASPMISSCHSSLLPCHTSHRIYPSPPLTCRPNLR